MRASKARSERQHVRRRRLVSRADEEGVEPTGPYELTKLLAGSVGDDHLFEVDSGCAQEHVRVLAAQRHQPVRIDAGVPPTSERDSSVRLGCC